LVVPGKQFKEALPRRIQNLALSNPAPSLFHLAKEA
jgi:hypothetical protein